MRGIILLLYNAWEISIFLRDSPDELVIAIRESGGKGGMELGEPRTSKLESRGIHKI